MHNQADVVRILGDNAQDTRNPLERDMLGGKQAVRLDIPIMNPDDLEADLALLVSELAEIRREFRQAKHPLVHAQHRITLLSKIMKRGKK